MFVGSEGRVNKKATLRETTTIVVRRMAFYCTLWKGSYIPPILGKIGRYLL